MRRTMRSRAERSTRWPNKTCSCWSGKATWQTRAFMAPRGSRLAKCSMRWNVPTCCPCRRVCSRCLRKAPRTVHRDGYIELQRAYYSVPPEYVGRQVWARWESRLLRVFNQRREVIAVHVLAEPGQFTTDPAHLHSPYRQVVQQSLEQLLDRARLIGPQTGSWAEAMVQQRGPIGTRVLHGLLSLAQKHPVKALESAAQKALHHGAWR